MGIILDADVIIRGEKGTFDLKAWLGTRPDDLFEVAAITVAELWHGVERASGGAQDPAPTVSSDAIGPVTHPPLYRADCL
jgi:predicted nucleic acid-binding protein